MADALKLRPRDYSGIVTCSPDDTLASIMRYIRERRVHRFVIVEPGEWDARTVTAEELELAQKEPQRAKHLPGRLVGMLSLSDVLRMIVGVQDSELRGMEIPGLGSSPETAPAERFPDDATAVDAVRDSVSALDLEPKAPVTAA